MPLTTFLIATPVDSGIAITHFNSSNGNCNRIRSCSDQSKGVNRSQ